MAILPNNIISEVDRTADSEQRFADVVAEAMRVIEACDRVDGDALLLRFPEFADRLREVLPAMQAVATWARPSAPSTSIPSEGDGQGVGNIQCLGDFRIIRQVGCGGMGVVYEAEQLSLGRKVALKILPLAAVMDPRQLQRFKNEVKAAALLQHQHIVPVYAVGCERGIHYYAMQYVEGWTLAEMVQQVRRAWGLDHELPPHIADHHLGQIHSALTRDFHPAEATERHTSAPQSGSSKSPRRSLDVDIETERLAGLSTAVSSRKRIEHYRVVARLVVQAAEALDHAHSRGVLHRDVKPSNLLVDATGNLWITDLGLARLQCEPGMTMTGDVVGTLRYMSPETAHSKREVVDHRTDIYSLGATLYELLALQPAHNGRDREELLRQITCEEPCRLRRLEPAIPVELETITRKAMEKSPADRYDTAQEMADDLQRFLHGRPIVAQPPSLADRCLKWSQRNYGVVWTAMLALGCMVVMLTGGSWMLWTANYRAVEALAASEVAAQESRQAAAETKTVLDFLTHHILDAGIPEKARGRQLTVAEALTNAASTIDGAFADQPLLEAAVRHALSNALMSLGKYEQALGHADKAHRLRQSHLGDQHPETLSSLLTRGSLRAASGDLPAAQATLEQVLEQSRRCLGAEHPETLRCLNELGLVLVEQDEMFERGLDMLRTTSEASRKVLGAEHPDTLSRIHNLAAALSSHNGRLDEAEERFRQIIEVERRKLGVDHPTTLSSIAQLANVLAQQGRLHESLQLHEPTLRNRRRVLGEDHPNTVRSMLDLGKTLHALNRHDEAQRLLESALQTAKSTVGLEDSLTRESLHGLVVMLSGQGHFAPAYSLIKETLSELERLPAGPGRDTICLDLADAMRSLAGGVRRTGDLVAAEAYLREALALAEPSAQNHPYLPTYPHPKYGILHDLAATLMEADRDSEAADIQQTIINSLEALRSGGDKSADLQLELARSYMNLGLWQSSRSLLAHSVELASNVLQRRPGDADARYLLAVTHANLATMLEDPEEQIAASQKAIEILEEALSYYYLPRRADTRLALAMAYLNLANRQALDRQDLPAALQSYDHGIEALQELLQDYPDDVQAGSTLSSAYVHRAANIWQKRANYDQAIRDCESALDIDSKNPEAYWIMGNNHAKRADWQAAIGAYRKAVELAPQSAQYSQVLAITLFDAGEYDPAIAAAAVAVQRDPNLRWNYDQAKRMSFVLAIAFHQNGNRDAAAEYYRQGLKWWDEKRYADLSSVKAQADDLLNHSATSIVERP